VEAVRLCLWSAVGDFVARVALHDHSVPGGGAVILQLLQSSVLGTDVPAGGRLRSHGSRIQAADLVAWKLPEAVAVLQQHLDAAPDHMQLDDLPLPVRCLDAAPHRRHLLT